LIDKTQINAVIQYTLPEIELQINALENLMGIRIYGVDTLKHFKPYEKLLKDMKKIRDDLIDKYNKSVEDNNRFNEPVTGRYCKDDEI
jgi:hypothetical protein|tara:strand:+ start:1871 stop:2134 length:264 start_codon:yes stop_codon:yes gene_type:complete